MDLYIVRHGEALPGTDDSARLLSDRGRAEFVFRLADKLEALPGVVQAGAVRKLPFTGWGWSSDFSIE